MKERVCALVSRIQGTFEFEVQPLREYFCAKFLYNTSPYSPPGAEKPGTKTDRFEAISRDSYWQNVTRFFAGCFDKGELPMLILKLNELQEDSLFTYTNHPRILTSQLLSDWVFSQYPNLLKDVVKVIINGLNIRGVLNQDEKFSNEPILLPIDCGRQEVVEQCFNNLKSFPSNDYALELILLLKSNPYNITEKWEEFALQLHGEKLTTWFKYGYLLQVIYKVNSDTLWRIIKSDNLINRERLQLAINGKADESLFKIKEIKDYLYNRILDSSISLGSNFTINYSLTYLSVITNLWQFTAILLSEVTHISLKTYIERDRYRLSSESFKFSIDNIEVDDPIDKNIYNFCSVINNILDKEVDLWRVDINLWDSLVENAKNSFGYCWSLCLISIVASGIKNKEQKCEEFNHLNDDKISLCKRVRFARLKSGNIRWWEEQLSASTYIEFHLLILFTWITPNSFDALSDILIDQCAKLSQEQLSKIINGMRKISRISPLSAIQQKQIIKIILDKNISEEIKYIISFRFIGENRNSFIYDYVNEYPGETQQILDIKLEYLIKKYVGNLHDNNLLEEIKQIYNRTGTFNEKVFMYRFRLSSSIEIPYQTAKEIMKNYMEYPRIIASLAEKSCRLHANNSITPVGSVAKKDKWFE